jgi:hypothetical protein
MKKIIIFLGIILTSCQSERVVVKVTVKTLTQDINESIVDGFYNNDTVGLTSKIYLLK